MKQTKYYYQDADAPKPNIRNYIGTNTLIDYRGRLLLEHRTDNNSWGIIGGGLEAGESLLQGAIREVREETGLLLSEEDLTFLKIYDDPSLIAEYPDGNILRIITVVYTVKLNQLPRLVCSEESRELKFFSENEIMHLDIVKSHQPILEEYRQSAAMRKGTEDGR